MKKECQQQSECRPRTPKGKNSEIVVLDVDVILDVTYNVITSFISLLTAIVLTAVWLNENNENNYL